VYEVVITRRAARQLRRVPPPHRQRCLAAIEGLRHRPRPPGCRKLAGLAHDWRIRVGSYRVLYRIDDGALLVTVIAALGRKHAYRI